MANGKLLRTLIGRWLGKLTMSLLNQVEDRSKSYPLEKCLVSDPPTRVVRFGGQVTLEPRQAEKGTSLRIGTTGRSKYP